MWSSSPEACHKIDVRQCIWSLVSEPALIYEDSKLTGVLLFCELAMYNAVGDEALANCKLNNQKNILYGIWHFFMHAITLRHQ